MSNTLKIKKNDVPVGFLSQNGLHLWLNRDRGVIGKVIAENGINPHYQAGRVCYYKLSEVVDGMVHGERLDVQQERAKLAKKQTEKTDLQIQQIRGDLIPREDVTKLLHGIITNCRMKLLSFPAKVASKVQPLNSLSEIEAELRSHIYEALEELSSNEIT